MINFCECYETVNHTASFNCLSDFDTFLNARQHIFSPTPNRFDGLNSTCNVFSMFSALFALQLHCNLVAEEPVLQEPCHKYWFQLLIFCGFHLLALLFACRLFKYCYVDLILLCLKLTQECKVVQPFLCKEYVDRAGPRHGHPGEANNLAPYKLIFFKLFWPRIGQANIFEGMWPNCRYFQRSSFARGKPECTSIIFLIIPVMS